MAEKNLSERVAELARRAAAVKEDASALVDEIAVAIHDRLVVLFEKRPEHEKAQVPDFEHWLGNQFVHDNYYVFTVTEHDEELKKLVDQLGTVDHQSGRRLAAEVINQRFQASGYRTGLANNLLDVTKLEPSPVSM